MYTSFKILNLILNDERNKCRKGLEEKRWEDAYEEYYAFVGKKIITVIYAKK